MLRRVRSLVVVALALALVWPPCAHGDPCFGTSPQSQRQLSEFAFSREAVFDRNPFRRTDETISPGRPSALSAAAVLVPGTNPVLVRAPLGMPPGSTQRTVCSGLPCRVMIAPRLSLARVPDPSGDVDELVTERFFVHPLATEFYGLALLDVNGDSRVDIVTLETTAAFAREPASQFVAYLNQGGAALAMRAGAPTAPLEPAGLPDLVLQMLIDADPLPDALVIADSRDALETVVISWMPRLAGALSFGAPRVFLRVAQGVGAYPRGAAPQMFAVRDVDRDGDEDLISYRLSNTTWVCYLIRTMPGGVGAISTLAFPLDVTGAPTGVYPIVATGSGVAATNGTTLVAVYPSVGAGSKVVFGHLANSTAAFGLLPSRSTTLVGSGACANGSCAFARFGNVDGLLGDDVVCLINVTTMCIALDGPVYGQLGYAVTRPSTPDVHLFAVTSHDSFVLGDFDGQNGLDLLVLTNLIPISNLTLGVRNVGYFVLYRNTPARSLAGVAGTIVSNLYALNPYGLVTGSTVALTAIDVNLDGLDDLVYNGNTRQSRIDDLRVVDVLFGNVNGTLDGPLSTSSELGQGKQFGTTFSTSFRAVPGQAVEALAMAPASRVVGPLTVTAQQVVSARLVPLALAANPAVPQFARVVLGPCALDYATSMHAVQLDSDPLTSQFVVGNSSLAVGPGAEALVAFRRSLTAGTLATVEPGALVDANVTATQMNIALGVLTVACTRAASLYVDADDRLDLVLLVAPVSVIGAPTPHPTWALADTRVYLAQPDGSWRPNATSFAPLAYDLVAANVSGTGNDLVLITQTRTVVIYSRSHTGVWFAVTVTSAALFNTAAALGTGAFESDRVHNDLFIISLGDVIPVDLQGLYPTRHVLSVVRGSSPLASSPESSPVSIATLAMAISQSAPGSTTSVHWLAASPTAPAQAVVVGSSLSYAVHTRTSATPALFDRPLDLGSMVGDMDVTALGDLDGDSLVDLAVVADGSLTVLYNDGTGPNNAISVEYGLLELTFGETTTATAVAMGDLNGDGAIDLAFADAETGAVAWSPALLAPLSDVRPTDVRAGRFGYLIAVAEAHATDVAITSSLTVVDCNADGRQDIIGVASNADATVVLAVAFVAALTEPPTFGATAWIAGNVTALVAQRPDLAIDTTANGYYQLWFVALDGDTTLDALMVNRIGRDRTTDKYLDAAVYVWPGALSGSMGDGQQWVLDPAAAFSLGPSGASTAALADMDGDGLGDIIWSTNQPAAPLMWAPRVSPQAPLAFGPARVLSLPRAHCIGATIVTAADVNGDGRVDVLCGAVQTTGAYGASDGDTSESAGRLEGAPSLAQAAHSSYSTESGSGSGLRAPLYHFRTGEVRLALLLNGLGPSGNASDLSLTSLWGYHPFALPTLTFAGAVQMQIVDYNLDGYADIVATAATIAPFPFVVSDNFGAEAAIVARAHALFGDAAATAAAAAADNNVDEPLAPRDAEAALTTTVMGVLAGVFLQNPLWAPAPLGRNITVRVGECGFTLACVVAAMADASPCGLDRVLLPPGVYGNCFVGSLFAVRRSVTLAARDGPGTATVDCAWRFGAALAAASAESLARGLFHVVDGRTLTIDGVNVRNAFSDYSQLGGGAFRVSGAGSRLVLASLAVTNCTAFAIPEPSALAQPVGFGGVALVLEGGALTTRDVTLADNLAGWSGGAVAVLGLGSIDLVRTTLANNRARLSGGAVYVGTEVGLSTVALGAAVFTRNTAGVGGTGTANGGAVAVTMLGGELRVTANSTQFTDNLAGSSGGALAVEAPGGAARFDAMLAALTASGNRASKGDGGALAIVSMSSLSLQMAIVGAELSDNVASGSGGAVAVRLSAAVADVRGLSFTDLVASGNRAGGSGGAFAIARNTLGAGAVSTRALGLALASLTFARAVLVDNTAALAAGGALVAGGWRTTLVDTVLGGNTAVWGGALALLSDEATLDALPDQPVSALVPLAPGVLAGCAQLGVATLTNVSFVAPVTGEPSLASGFGSGLFACEARAVIVNSQLMPPSRAAFAASSTVRPQAGGFAFLCVPSDKQVCAPASGAADPCCSASAPLSAVGASELLPWIEIDAPSVATLVPWVSAIGTGAGSAVTAFGATVGSPSARLSYASASAAINGTTPTGIPLSFRVAEVGAVELRDLAGALVTDPSASLELAFALPAPAGVVISAGELLRSAATGATSFGDVSFAAVTEAAVGTAFGVTIRLVGSAVSASSPRAVALNAALAVGACPPGLGRLAAATEAFVSCALCPLNTASSETSLAACAACPADSFNPLIGAKRCLACPAATERVGVFVDPTTGDVGLNCSCLSGFWRSADASVTTECSSCPPGGRCTGGSAQPVAAAGTFPSGKPGVFLDCPVTSACLGEGRCARGSTGRLCGRCERGFYTLNGRCLKCSPGQSEAVLLLMVLASLALSAALIWLNLRRAASIRYAAVLIGLNSLQLLGLMGQIQLAFPAFARQYIAALSLLNVNFELGSPECAVGTGDLFVVKFIVMGLVPLYFVAVFAAFTLGGMALARRHQRGAGERGARRIESGPTMVDASAFGANAAADEDDDATAITAVMVRDAGVRGFYQLMLLVYLALTSSSLGYFRCSRSRDGTFYMAMAPSRRCYVSEYWHVWPLALIYAALWAFGIPLVFVLGLRVLRRRAEAAGELLLFEMRYAFTIARYSDAWYLYEGAVLARSLGVVFALSIFQSPVSQAFAAYLALLVAAAQLMVARPYRAREHNAMAIVCLASISMVLWAATLVGVVSRSVGVYVGLTVLTLAVVVGNVFDATALRRSAAAAEREFGRGLAEVESVNDHTATKGDFGDDSVQMSVLDDSLSTVGNGSSQVGEAGLTATDWRARPRGSGLDGGAMADSHASLVTAQY